MIRIALATAFSILPFAAGAWTADVLAPRILTVDGNVEAGETGAVTIHRGKARRDRDWTAASGGPADAVDMDVACRPGAAGYLELPDILGGDGLPLEP